MKKYINKVHCEDCIQLLKELPDKSIDMILCDLPYQITANSWDKIIPFDKLWESYNRIIKDNGAIVLTASQPFTSLLICSNLKMFKYCWVWNKKMITNPMLAKKQPLKQHEDIVVFYKKPFNLCSNIIVNVLLINSFNSCNLLIWF